MSSNAGYMDGYNAWLNDDYFDETTKEELRAIGRDEKEIEDRFYQNLAFGTGGLRGLLGAGTNRMNIYTVSKATQGLANYILKQGADFAARGVVIAHDPRHKSPEFSIRAALVLNGNGIKTYVFDSLRPTPELSFAVRHLGCAAGIVVTASHNPKDYNGYKVYWCDGGQILHPMDGEIIGEVNSVADFRQIKIADIEEAKRAGLFYTLPGQVDEEYLKNVRAQSLNPGLITERGGNVTVVYSPFNGAGNVLVRRALADMGFTKVHVVPEQELPDPDFTTLGYPNPEDQKAFALALALAEKVDADVIIATDPDSDRLGVMAKEGGEYAYLTGNMTGSLMAEYILSQRSAKGTLPKNGAVISTIVSTRLTAEIARAYGAAYFDVLTGFKYFGEKMRQFEETGSHEFIFGFEESIGFLAGSHSRDKDAVVSAMLLCEMALFYKEQGLTLCGALARMYEKYGYYMEKTVSITMKGLDGLMRITRIMESLRNDPPERVCGAKVVGVKDYKNSVYVNTRTGEREPITLPVSNVIYCETEDGAWFCARPSGTEPKIKIYCGVKGTSARDAADRLERMSAGVVELAEKAGE